MVVVLLAACGKGGKGDSDKRYEFLQSSIDRYTCNHSDEGGAGVLRAECEKHKTEEYKKLIQDKCAALREVGFTSVRIKSGQHDVFTASTTDCSFTSNAADKKFALKADTTTSGAIITVENTDCMIDVGVKDARATTGSLDDCKDYDYRVAGEAPRDVDSHRAGWVPLAKVMGSKKLADIVARKKLPDVTVTVKRGSEELSATGSMGNDWSYVLNTIIADPAKHTESGIGAKGSADGKTMVIAWHGVKDVTVLGDPTFESVDLVAHETHSRKSETGPCGLYGGGGKTQGFQIVYVPSIVKVIDPRTGKTIEEKTFLPAKTDCPDKIEAGNRGALITVARKPMLEWLEARRAK